MIGPTVVDRVPTSEEGLGGEAVRGAVIIVSVKPPRS
jgi:hypothetical protein